MLSNFYISIYKKFIEVLSWILLIVAIIAGGVIGHKIGWYENEVLYTFLGIIIGIISAFIIEAMIVPPLIIIFKMYDQIVSIDQYTKKIRNSYEYSVTNIPERQEFLKNQDILEKQRLSSEKKNNDSWVCKKCGTANSINSMSCKICGEYR